MQEAWPPQGEFVYYSIIKINKDGKSNRKSVKLDCGEQGKWSVSPTLLTLIK